MKKIYIITALLILSLVLMNCSKEDSNMITIAINNTSSSESDTSSTSGTTSGPTATPISGTTPSPSEGLPVNLMGVSPEEKTVSVTTTVPSGTTQAIVSLYGYDFDNPFEGYACINGNTKCFQLFGVDNDSNNDAYTTIQYIIDASWLVNGTNTFRFTHESTEGYIIESISITY